MKKPFRIEPDAADELSEATQWYESRRSGLGRELLLAIDDSLNFLDQWPGSGSLIPKMPRDLPVRRVPVRRFPYHLVYLETEAAMRIPAFAHDHRRPGYWRSRI